MDVWVIGVGKIKERYIADGLAEFQKRLKAYTSFRIIEVPDERAPEGLSRKEEDLVRAREAERILRHIKPGHTVAALDLKGQMITSEGLADLMEKWALSGRSDIAFVIGGSLGLHQSVLERADVILSFGRVTFPHQLMRLILLEQIYRVFKISRGEPYHK